MSAAAATVRRAPDWRLVMANELRNLLGRLGRRPLKRTAGVVVIFGLLLPLRFQAAANLPAFFAALMAFVPSRLVAIDAFAGERERGTLESLLALPLTDRGIALGKIAAATVYGAARGWLFVAIWLPAAAVLRAVGVLDAAAFPSAWVVVATIVAIALVAVGAAVFGVWQSAAAPSVRAISESGGLLRLMIIVAVFFVLPWFLGLLSPTGDVPMVSVPGGGQVVSATALRAALAARPGVVAALAAATAVIAVGGTALLVRDTLRRCRRERLALAGERT